MKERILDNVAEYSAQQLVKYIQDGVISLDELINETDGFFDASKRKEVEDFLKNGDDNAWNEAYALRTIDAAKQYLNTYPNGKHRNEARDLISNIKEENESNYLKSTTDDAWTCVDINDIDELRNFVKKYPDSNHINDANILINNILLDEIMGVDAETLVSQIRQFQTDISLTPAQKDNNILDTIERFLKEKKLQKKSF